VEGVGQLEDPGPDRDLGQHAIENGVAASEFAAALGAFLDTLDDMERSLADRM
jgi:hypothetical protein